MESLGAEFYGRINQGKDSQYIIAADSITSKINNFLGYFLHGVKLKSYEFKKNINQKGKRLITLSVTGVKNKPSISTQLRFKALEEGTFYARDLVSEPGNILHPDEYARRLNSLKKDGLKINIYDEKKLKNLECILYLELAREVSEVLI